MAKQFDTYIQYNECCGIRSYRLFTTPRHRCTVCTNVIMSTGEWEPYNIDLRPLHEREEDQ